MEKKTTRMRALSAHEISVFSTQLAMLVKSGSSPYEAVALMQQDTTDAGGKQILQTMLEKLETGERLHTAIEASGVFPAYVPHMLAIGEESGRLDTVLDSLGEFYEQEDNLNETIRSSLRYPLIMIATMFVVIFVLITQVLPIFADVFAQLGTGMNAFSESLLSLGMRMNRSLFLVIAVLLAILVFALYLFRTGNGRRLRARIAAALPFTRALSDEIAASRFANGMALMLSSGMDTYRSLDMVKEVIENDRIREKIARTAHLIGDENNTFPEALEKTGIFSSLYTRMLKAGFKSGSMDVTLRRIASHYEKSTDRKIHNLISVVEPTLIIVLSVVVGLILLSVIMPLMGIMGSIG